MNAETLLREISTRFVDRLDKDVIIDGSDIIDIEYDIETDSIRINTEPMPEDPLEGETLEEFDEAVKDMKDKELETHRNPVDESQFEELSEEELSEVTNGEQS